MINDPFSAALAALPEALLLSYEQAIKDERLSTDQQGFTKAILLRLKTYYQTQDAINAFLGKKVKGNAADFFVETVNFYLRVFLVLKNLEADVISEVSVAPRLRPDISIRQNKVPTAFIECKTQLGWDRSGWEQAFRQREQHLARIFPDAVVFLLIATEENWKMTESAGLWLGKQYFILSKLWPSKFQEARLAETIVNPIEGLFHQIADRCKPR